MLTSFLKLKKITYFIIFIIFAYPLFSNAKKNLDYFPNGINIETIGTLPNKFKPTAILTNNKTIFNRINKFRKDSEEASAKLKHNHSKINKNYAKKDLQLIDEFNLLKINRKTEVAADLKVIKKSRVILSKLNKNISHWSEANKMSHLIEGILTKEWKTLVDITKN